MWSWPSLGRTRLAWGIYRCGSRLSRAEPSLKDGTLGATFPTSPSSPSRRDCEHGVITPKIWDSLPQLDPSLTTSVLGIIVFNGSGTMEVTSHIPSNEILGFFLASGRRHIQRQLINTPITVTQQSCPPSRKDPDVCDSHRDQQVIIYVFHSVMVNK